MNDRVAAFERHRRHLTGIAYRMLGSLSDAEDVVQEAFIRFEAATDIRDDRAFLTTVTSRLALDAPIPGGGKLHDLAREVMAIARAGLAARGRLNSSGDNETGFLETLDEIVATGKVPAQVMLDRYNGEWGGDIDRIYKYSF